VIINMAGQTFEAEIMAKGRTMKMSQMLILETKPLAIG